MPGAPERPSGPTRDATLVRVVDGDTIRVMVGGVEERVRYIGMDTPELNESSKATPEPFAEAATAANARLLAGADRLVLERDVSERDRYGRLLADVWVERAGTWTLVGLALVAEGFAQVSTFPPDVKYVDALLAAQREARAAVRGLWGGERRHDSGSGVAGASRANQSLRSTRPGASMSGRPSARRPPARAISSALSAPALAGALLRGRSLVETDPARRRLDMASGRQALAYYGRATTPNPGPQRR